MGMAEGSASTNSLVFAYLASVSAKLAKSFKKEVGSNDIKELPTDSPTISDMVISYHELERKRKLDDSLNGTPNAKRAKMNGAKPAEKESSDSDDDSSEEEEVAKEPTPKAAPAKKEESSDSDDSDSDEEEAAKPVANGKPALTNGKAKDESSDDDSSSDEDEEEDKPAPKAKDKPVVAKKAE